MRVVPITLLRLLLLLLFHLVQLHVQFLPGPLVLASLKHSALDLCLTALHLRAVHHL